MPGYKLNASLSLVLLPTTTITTAVTGVLGSVFTDLVAMESLTVLANFVYGAGTGTVKVWVQTSFDQGTTFVDVMCFAFVGTSAKKISSVRVGTAVAAAYVPGDKTMGDDLAKDGLLGDRIRVALTTTGTYSSGTTIALTAVVKG